MHCNGVFLLSPLKPALSKATAFLRNTEMTSSKKARENRKQELKNPASGKRFGARPPNRFVLVAMKRHGEEGLDAVDG